MAIDDNVIDARGQKCPLPVLKLEKRLAQVGPGTIITVMANDPIAKIDIPLHCRQNGHSCAQSESEGAMRFVVTKSGAAAP